MLLQRGASAKAKTYDDLTILGMIASPLKTIPLPLGITFHIWSLGSKNKPVRFLLLCRTLYEATESGFSF